MQTIMAGGRAILMERFSARGALETIERERITFIATAPASIVAMLNAPDLEKFELSSLRVVVTGGTSAAIETSRDFRERMKQFANRQLRPFSSFEAGMIRVGRSTLRLTPTIREMVRSAYSSK